MKMDSEQITQK